MEVVEDLNDGEGVLDGWQDYCDEYDPRLDVAEQTDSDDASPCPIANADASASGDPQRGGDPSPAAAPAPGS